MFREQRKRRLREDDGASNGEVLVRQRSYLRFACFLVATPGQHAFNHMTHVPFMMARAGSPIAASLGFTPAPGVVPAAFDTQLIGSRSDAFVFRSLANTSVDVVSGVADRVANEASQMAQMNHIAPGKRVRRNVEQWASSTISLRGGRLDNRTPCEVDWACTSVLPQ